MKALIVDEELHVRDTIRSLTDWNTLEIDTVLEANSCLLAKSILEHERPEIVITDMMMLLCNGMDMLEWIQLRAIPCKIIVISGQYDMEFMRHAVKYGGSVYLLKPLDPVQLQQALLNAVKSWKQDEQLRVQEHQHNMEMNRIKPVYRDKLLSTLLKDNSEFHMLQEHLYQEFPSMKNATVCTIAVLSLDTMEQSIRERFAYRLDLLYFSLINICNEILERKQAGTAFRNWTNDSEIIILLWNHLSDTESIISQVSRSMRETLRAEFDFGVGRQKHFPEQLHESYKEARSALRNRNLLEKGSRITIYEQHSEERPGALRLTDFEEHIRMAVRSGRQEQIEEAVNQWIAAVVALERITIEQLELWGHEYNMLKARWVEDLFMEEVPELRLPSEGTPFIVPMDSKGRISIELWQQELTESMLRLAKRLQAHHLQGANILFDIARYLDQHYARDLTLQDLADHFFLSREYISRKFKQQFGENVIEYLSRVRIDKSKLLLHNPLLKIADVAQAVGYQDEKYFSKVFKKRVGVSPNEYRKTTKLLETVESN